MRTVPITMGTLQRWISNFEQDAKDLSENLSAPELRDEQLEIAVLRAAVLRHIVKHWTCELPKTVTVRIALDA